MSAADEGTSAEHIGYKRPPRATRFAKGQSGNPGGRPRNRQRQLPYDTVLGQMVTIREDGRERRVTAAEAFILQLTRKGLQGDSAAARASLAAIETARAARPNATGTPDVMRIVLVGMSIGHVVKNLGMAVKKHPQDKERVRYELQPWIVEAALAQLGTRTLTHEEQCQVWNATRKPHEVTWPQWWIYRG